MAPAATPQANPSPIAGVAPAAARARGSQQAIEARPWQPTGRGAPGHGRPARPTPPPPPPNPPPFAPTRFPPPSYDMAAHRNHDAIVRRIIWISVIAAVIIAIVIATH